MLAHGNYIHSLYKKGVVIEGGSFLDHSGGMAILAVEDLEQAKEFANQDPAVIEGVFTAELHPWMRVDWENFG